MRNNKSLSTRINPDGSITTKHGHRIVQYEIKRRNDENKFGLGLNSNKVKFMLQPRVQALTTMLEPLLRSPHFDMVHLDVETGYFYLRSDITKNGIANACALGVIDVDLERNLLHEAVLQVRLKKMLSKVAPKQLGTLKPSVEERDQLGRALAEAFTSSGQVNALDREDQVNKDLLKRMQKLEDEVQKLSKPTELDKPRFSIPKARP